MPRRGRWSAGLTLALVAAPAYGHEAPGAPIDRASTAPDERDGTANESRGSRWRRGPQRAFASSAIDVGFQYFRPRVSFGYGRPHETWAGLDANPIVSGAAAGAYSGARLASRVVDLRAGGRYYYGFRRSFLPVQRAYDRQDIEFRGGENAQYVAWESELTLTIPAGPGVILNETAVTWVPGAPDDRYVYEETIRVVMTRDGVGRFRLGYGLAFAEDRALKVAAVGEVVHLRGRDMNVVRAGLLVRLQVFDDLEARVNLVPVVHSRDSLGISGADFGQLGIRWLWATAP